MDGGASACKEPGFLSHRVELHEGAAPTRCMRVDPEFPEFIFPRGELLLLSRIPKIRDSGTILKYDI